VNRPWIGGSLAGDVPCDHDPWFGENDLYPELYHLGDLDWIDELEGR